MIARESWGFHPAWLDWVRRVWVPGLGRVQQQYTGGVEFEAFSRRAAQAFREASVPLTRLKVWVSVQVPEDGSGYAHGYPHVHYPLDAWTLVHYLDPGDKPAALHVLDGEHGEIIDRVIPEAGLTVRFRNDTWHGAEKNNGTLDRVQLIATALPR